MQTQIGPNKFLFSHHVKGLTEKRALSFCFISTVPKLGFGTAGLFEDTKSSVLSALSTGYRYCLLLVYSTILFANVWPNDICDLVVDKLLWRSVNLDPWRLTERLNAQMRSEASKARTNPPSHSSRGFACSLVLPSTGDAVERDNSYHIGKSWWRHWTELLTLGIQTSLSPTPSPLLFRVWRRVTFQTTFWGLKLNPPASQEHWVKYLWKLLWVSCSNHFTLKALNFIEDKYVFKAHVILKINKLYT